MDLSNSKKEKLKEIRAYLSTNKDAVEKEYKINIPSNVSTDMSAVSLSAWIQVYTSKIFMAKNVEECAELKDLIKDFIAIEREENYTEMKI